MGVGNGFMNVFLLTPDFAAEMAEMEKVCFSVPWSYESLCYELQNPIAFYFGVLRDGVLAGYGGIQIVLNEGYITNIATNPVFRRQGIADAVLGRILSEARERELSFVTLETRFSNIPAQRLYQKHGFETAGRRKNYYQKPREDALIMTRQF